MTAVQLDLISWLEARADLRQRFFAQRQLVGELRVAAYLAGVHGSAADCEAAAGAVVAAEARLRDLERAYRAEEAAGVLREQEHAVARIGGSKGT